MSWEQRRAAARLAAVLDVLMNEELDDDVDVVGLVLAQVEEVRARFGPDLIDMEKRRLRDELRPMRRPQLQVL